MLEVALLKDSGHMSKVRVDEQFDQTCCERSRRDLDFVLCCVCVFVCVDWVGVKHSRVRRKRWSANNSDWGNLTCMVEITFSTPWIHHVWKHCIGQLIDFYAKLQVHVLFGICFIIHVRSDMIGDGHTVRSSTAHICYIRHEKPMGYREIFDLSKAFFHVVIMVQFCFLPWLPCLFYSCRCLMLVQVAAGPETLRGIVPLDIGYEY